MSRSLLTTIAIVEDDPVIRAGWVKIINRSSGYRCVSDYGSAEAAIGSPCVSR